MCGYDFFRWTAKQNWKILKIAVSIWRWDEVLISKTKKLFKEKKILENRKQVLKHFMKHKNQKLFVSRGKHVGGYFCFPQFSLLYCWRQHQIITRAERIKLLVPKWQMKRWNIRAEENALHRRIESYLLIHKLDYTRKTNNKNENVRAKEKRNNKIQRLFILSLGENFARRKTCFFCAVERWISL